MAKSKARKRGRQPARAAAPAPGPDDDLPAVVRQHRLGMRYRRHDIAVDHKATDPANPNGVAISRPQLNPAHHRLRKSGGITPECSRAADRYGELVEIANGTSPGQSEGEGGSPPWMRSPTERQVKAATKVRRMRGIWGKRAAMIVDLLVIENLSKEWISERLGQNHQRTLGEIVAALERCAEEWGIQPRPRHVAHKPEPRKRDKEATAIQ